ncbi:hypothetical protein HYH03_002375 [Edaphochlamys debaryana]|uniref:Uncharacterized protein n=1 Tax=Edaphochlamys debaryana TaxID=47281 RepID=A0A835YB45_9CHLO|nr:hypothetical protein HYH03_002375 [Edaphochlamys debaryana]|eukprot:KAG2499428.1 hypothetical protein HYH03_002375 [Edaphochlamys debaryana]
MVAHMDREGLGAAQGLGEGEGPVNEPGTETAAVGSAQGEELVGAEPAQQAAAGGHSRSPPTSAAAGAHSGNGGAALTSSSEAAAQDAAVAAAVLLLRPPPPANSAAAAAAGAWLSARVRSLPVLVGPDYYGAKQSLLAAEALLLRALGFEVCVAQPFAFLLNAARCLRLPPGQTRLALALLNDLWLGTRLGTLGAAQQQRAVAAVLEAAARLSGQPVWVPPRATEAGLRGWWQLLGVGAEEAEMEALVGAVLQALVGIHRAAETGGAQAA